MSRSRHIALVGDVHGHLHAMVRLLRRAESRLGVTLDAVLQVGDFEPHRDGTDVLSMVAPARYRLLGDFPAYLHGRELLPWPVYFIGGNHEPHAHLEPLAQGGQVGPRCHYLGRVGSAQVAGLRVIGLSGIYSEDDYRLARLPFVPGAERNAAYAHFTESEVEAALELGQPDILLVHDWPASLPGADALPKGRRGFDYGNAPARVLVDLLKPRLVACGHIHRRFRSRIVHSDGSATDVHCLADIESGAEGFAIIEVTPEGLAEKT